MTSTYNFTHTIGHFTLDKAARSAVRPISVSQSATLHYVCAAVDIFLVILYQVYDEK